MKRKKVNIKLLRTGEMTWASPSGQSQRKQHYTAGEILEVFVEPEATGLKDHFQITDSLGWTVLLENVTFEVLKTDAELVDDIIREAKGMKLQDSNPKSNPAGVLLAIKALADSRARFCAGVPDMAFIGREWMAAAKLIGQAAEQIAP